MVGRGCCRGHHHPGLRLTSAWDLGERCQHAPAISPAGRGSHEFVKSVLPCPRTPAIIDWRLLWGDTRPWHLGLD